MQIGIRGVFGFSEIFDGTLDFTTSCQLELLGGYSLIYAEVQDLDVLQTLNQAFNLGLGDLSLNVTSAGFFTFSVDRNAPAVKLNSVFPDSPVPATVAAGALPVVDTTSFWLSVDLSGNNGDQGLFGSLVNIGVAPGTQLSLSATFAKDTRAATAISTADYTLSLDGEINLFKLFAFSNLSVSYSIGAATKVTVSGKIKVGLFGSEFKFSGSVLSDSVAQAVTANVQAEGNADLGSLFGGDFPNIAFTGIRFNLYYPYGQNTQAAQFMVRGGCMFGGLAFTGLLYMQGTTPILGSVVFTQPASISTLFDQCIPHASWPSNLIDLTLDANSQVYYSKSAQPLQLTLSNDGSGPTLLPVPTTVHAPGSVVPPVAGGPVLVTFQPGFNVSASFTLSLLNSIEVSGDVVVNANGVTASIDIADPVDIYILQITRQGEPTRGPVLSITTEGASGSMQFAAALLFFGQDFGTNATVALTKSSGSLLASATLSPTRDYPPLLTTADQLGFSYSQSQGFQLTNWPDIQAAQDIVDFFDALKKAADAGSSGCGRLANFVCQNLLKQSYSITPAFSSEGSALSLTLSIVCTLSFLGDSQDTSFATITLPNAVIVPIPTSVSLDPDSPQYLWTVIVDAIGSIASSFIDALLSNGDALATFLVLFGGQQAISYAATLICQGITDAAVSGAVAAGVEAAGAALGTGAAVAAAIASAVAASNGGHGGGSGGGGGGTSPPSAPTNVSAQISGANITGLWSPSSGAQNYVATLTGPQGTLGNSGTLPYDATAFAFGTVTRPSNLPATATLAVVASNPKGQSPAGTASITFLAAPTGVAAQPASPSGSDVEVQINWSASAGASAYMVNVAGGKTESIPTQTTSANLLFAPEDPAGVYSIAVVATGGAMTVASPASVSLSLMRLAAPANLTSQPSTATSGAAAQIHWAAVGGATGYVLALSGPRSSRQDSAAPGFIIQFAPDDPPGAYQLTIMATGGVATIPSTWSEPLALTRLASPTAFSVQATTVSIEASWAAVPDAAAYMLSWTNPGGVTGDVPVTPSSGTVVRGTFLLPVPIVDGTWAVTVQAVPAEGPGPFVASPFAAPLNIMIAGPTSPESMASGYFADGVEGGTCGRNLVIAFPTLVPDVLAISMAQGGYSAPSTADGLHAAYPSITPTQMAQALADAFPSAPTTAEELSLSCFARNVSGPDCGKQLISAFADLTPNPLASAMAKAGYAADATASGLHSAFPSISAQQMAQALALAFPSDPSTPVELALSCFIGGVDSTACGRQLIEAYPNLIPETLAVAMAEGGYAAGATASGLMAAFPQISPQQMALALAKAYA
jgi:hypothetical protein